MGRIAEYFVFKAAIQKRKDFGTITMPVVLHRCETWSLTLGEERKMRVFRRIFRPKRE
jgi:hypothetical protein